MSARLARSGVWPETTTYCPFKGTASYWSLPDARDVVAQIKDHFCFYEVEAAE